MKVPLLQMAAMRDLRARVFADPALQASLAAVTDNEAFADRLVAEAERRGIALKRCDAAAALRLDPLDVVRFAPRAPDGERWPGPGWMPVHASAMGGEPHVDWLYLGNTRSVEPFFEETIRRMQWLPFNRAFRYRMRLTDFLASGEAGPDPDGLIFHMSRCGSTLAARMLATLPDSLVLSEPPPVDEVLHLALRAGEDTAVAALRTTVAAFSRHAGRPFVLKADAWHTLALPLFRRAFPATPWVFLYRDPTEVMVSHMRVRGAQMVPGIVAPSLYGLAADVPDETYCARVLEVICRAAADHFALGGGLFVNYSQLPSAVEEMILPHFNIVLGDAERDAFRAAARQNAKAPLQTFVRDGEAKRREASEAVRGAVARHLAGIYDRLEGIGA